MLLTSPISTLGSSQTRRMMAESVSKREVGEVGEVGLVGGSVSSMDGLVANPPAFRSLTFLFQQLEQVRWVSLLWEQKVGSGPWQHRAWALLQGERDIEGDVEEEGDEQGEDTDVVDFWPPDSPQ